MKLRALLIALAIAVIPAQAGAADPDRPKHKKHRVRESYPETDPFYQSYFRGLYWGASLGYGWGDSTQMYNRAGNHGLASTAPSGVLGSLTLGYNMPITSIWLLGLEADLGLMDVSADDKVVYDGHIYKTQFGPTWGTLRGRAGYMMGRTMIYGTGGFAFMQVDEVSIGNTPGETATNRDLRAGWVLGAGVEYAITPFMSGKLEYLHMDFGRYSGLSANRESYYFDNSLDLVRVGLNMKF